MWIRRTLVADIDDGGLHAARGGPTSAGYALPAGHIRDRRCARSGTSLQVLPP
jgi:hypothetical protein